MGWPVAMVTLSVAMVTRPRYQSEKQSRNKVQARPVGATHLYLRIQEVKLASRAGRGGAGRN